MPPHWRTLDQGPFCTLEESSFPNTLPHVIFPSRGKSAATSGTPPAALVTGWILLMEVRPITFSGGSRICVEYSAELPAFNQPRKDSLRVFAQQLVRTERQFEEAVALWYNKFVLKNSPYQTVSLMHQSEPMGTQGKGPLLKEITAGRWAFNHPGCSRQ